MFVQSLVYSALAALVCILNMVAIAMPCGVFLGIYIVWAGLGVLWLVAVFHEQFGWAREEEMLEQRLANPNPLLAFL